jgi:transposase
MLDDRHLEQEVADLGAKESADARHQHSAEGFSDEYRRVELITGRRRRRDWTLEEKAEILAASLEPGRTVTEVADRYQVSRALLWTWRRNARDALVREGAPAFVSLKLEEPAGASTAVTSGLVSEADHAQVADTTSPPSGSIEIAVGRARVRVQGMVDAEALRQVLALAGTIR